MSQTHTMYELEARALQVKYKAFFAPSSVALLFVVFCRAEKFKYNSLKWFSGKGVG